MNDGAAAAIEHRTEVVERPLQIDVGDIDLPMFVRQKWLDESRSFFGGSEVVFSEDAGHFEKARDTGGTTGDHIGVNPGIALQFPLPVIHFHLGSAFADINSSFE